MRAIVQTRFGGPEVLNATENPDLDPAPGEVRIAVCASGVHLIDLSIRSGEPPGALPAPTLPMIPGREVAGRIDRIGAALEQSWLGERVVVHLGSANGGYAEQAVASLERLHRIPAGLSFATAVAAIGTGRTALGILDQAPVTAADVVVIPSAAGGLGSTLVQSARSAGAFVVGLAGGPHKVEIVRSLGADLVVDYRRAGWPERLRTLLGDRTPTLVFDGVSGMVGEACYKLLGSGGRLIQFGWSSGDRTVYDDPDRPALLALGPHLTSRPGGLRSLEAEALAKAADGSVVPLVGSTFPLSHAARAHRALARRETHGKVVLVPDTAP